MRRREEYGAPGSQRVIGGPAIPSPGEDDPIAGRVRAALAALDPRDREVLLLAEWEGLAPAEIAKVMRCPAVTMRGRLHRARLRFRAAFESQEATASPEHLFVKENSDVD
jgi:RNA polymerase sigma-70 factor (ECF subfamily)